MSDMEVLVKLAIGTLLLIAVLTMIVAWILNDEDK